MESKLSSCTTRRALLKSTCGLVGATALVSIGGSLSAFAVGGAMPRPKDNGVPRVGDTFVFSDGQRKGSVVSLADLVIGPPILAQAKDTASGTVRESDHSTVLFLRVSPEKVPVELKESSVEGVLAYSALCTHLGCVLSDWVENKNVFRCPCHEATFDPMQAGKWSGDGPQSRTLPILPLKVVDGKLVVADVFTGTVGPKRS